MDEPVRKMDKPRPTLEQERRAMRGILDAHLEIMKFSFPFKEKAEKSPDLYEEEHSI